MKAFLAFLSSSRLALVLVLIILLFSVIGTVVPQEGLMPPWDIAKWQQKHQTLTAIFKAPGFFHVFVSWPFLVSVLILGINTLTCTIRHFIKQGGFSSFKKSGALKFAGFLFLHISLIVLFSAGALSAALKFKGYIYITEGETFIEKHNSYKKIAEGPLRTEKHKEFGARLNKLDVNYQNKRYLVDTVAHVEFMDKPGKGIVKEIRFNQPSTYRGVDFTLDEIGYSPRLIIADKASGKRLIDAFIALKTFKHGGGRLYKDFLPIPIFDNKVFITLLPSYVVNKGKPQKTSEEPDKPLLIIEMENKSGEVVSRDYLPAGSRITIGEHTFLFAGLRRWAAFTVTDDPGYIVALVGLWIGLIALIIRYIPDLKEWFREKTVN